MNEPVEDHAANAAAAGRLILVLLFAANAVVYTAHGYGHAVMPVLGMAQAILAATLGYFACSRATFGQSYAALLNASLVMAVASGISFLVSA